MSLTINLSWVYVFVVIVALLSQTLLLQHDGVMPALTRGPSNGWSIGALSARSNNGWVMVHASYGCSPTNACNAALAILMTLLMPRQA